MVVKNKETFDFTHMGDNGEEQTVKLALIAPTRGILQKARMEHNKAFAEGLQHKSILRSMLNKYMEEQGLWDEKREQEYKTLFEKIDQGEKSLSKGNIKLSQARYIAIQIRSARRDLQNLLAERTSLDAYTAEGQAENVRFNSLLAQCLVYNDTGKPYFKNLDEYLEKADERLAVMAAEKFAAFQFGLSEDYESTLVENQFLKKWDFVDDNLRLVDKAGRLVNEDGQLIDLLGRNVNEDGNLVDDEGSPIDDEGNYAFDSQPFLDDNGKPIVEDSDVANEKKATVKKKTPRKRVSKKKTSDE